VTLVESRQLESVGDELLDELGDFYRAYFALVDGRRLTPYSFGLEPDKVDLVPVELLYEEKFLSGGSEEVRKIKSGVNNEIERSQEDNGGKEGAMSSLEMVVVGENNDEEDLVGGIRGEKVMKWEKVKKKVK
jgi:hypothetical protein